MKIHKKIKIGTQEKGIFCYEFQSILNLKMIYFFYNVKNMSSHLTPKSYYFRLSPEDDNAMETSYFNDLHGLYHNYAIPTSTSILR